ncbi:gamma-glutamyl-gamma-aminobutyrate hydrolase family protein [Archangium lansingense]|uniref:gamma-glutamyl-gamma-aminobutyrate hydrolase family protein n=1 Tax=Archangium lansingense TaxID=2995310 RepID=UPI003B816416
MPGLLGDKKVSPKERAQRAFCVMWNWGMEISRTLKDRQERGGLLTLNEIHWYNDVLKWARESNVPSLVHKLTQFDDFVSQSEEKYYQQMVERSREERQKELKQLATRGPSVKSFKGKLKSFQGKAIDTIRVGVSFRIDQSGKAHTYDVDGVMAMNKLGLPFKIEAVALPLGASGSKTPVREASWDELKTIDILYIPGAPVANDTQVGATKEDSEVALARLKKPFELTEHNSRSGYEVRLLQMAQTLGIPVLAICAGSWRLLQAYGGRVRTLPKEERDRHKSENTAQTWNLKHDIQVEEDSLLHDMVQLFELPDSNTTHWAVADESSPGTLALGPLSNRPVNPHTDQPSRNPRELLRISARTSGDEHENTIEGFESRSGAPHLGIQWHPESNLPGMPGFETASVRQKKASARLFTGMAQAGYASRARRNVGDELRARFQISRLRQVLGLHSDDEAREEWEKIAEKVEGLPTDDDIRHYLIMFNLAF